MAYRFEVLNLQGGQVACQMGFQPAPPQGVASGFAESEAFCSPRHSNAKPHPADQRAQALPMRREWLLFLDTVPGRIKAPDKQVSLCGALPAV
jgi:hypothetical protein